MGTGMQIGTLQSYGTTVHLLLVGYHVLLLTDQADKDSFVVTHI